MSDKKATKGIEFALVLPKMHQQVSILFDQKAPSNFHSQAMLPTLHKESRKPYCRDATFLTLLLGVRLLTKH